MDNHSTTELDAFKRFDFATVAAAFGYSRDNRASTNVSAVLRSDSDKVVVKPDGDHWVYFSVHDLADHGSIIDFVQRRTGGTLGAIRKLLRDITGARYETFPPTARSFQADSSDYRKKSLAVWNAATWNAANPYLLDRGLDRGTLADHRFADTFRQDTHGNVVFPHYDRGGMCGYERRGHEVKTFGKDVKKGLWFTPNIKAASAIVVTESAIDALSHFRLYGWDVGYVALGGSIGSRQRDLLAGLFAKSADRQVLVVIATDNDEAGDQFFEQLGLLAPMRLKRHKPIGKDWNDDLAFCNREQGGTTWN